MPFLLIREAFRFALLFFQPAAALRAENLVLRRQLAHFLERGQRPRRSTDGERMAIALACRLFDWRSAVAIVKPATVVRWQRELGRMFWRRKSLRGRPPLPGNIRELIVRMDRENPSWGEQRIADELLVKLGVRVSARTVAKYLRGSIPGGRRPRRDQRWSTFIRNHARAIVACDFAVSMTLSFEIVYIFVAMEVGSRRILHVNTTRHPTRVRANHHPDATQFGLIETFCAPHRKRAREILHRHEHHRAPTSHSPLSTKPLQHWIPNPHVTLSYPAPQLSGR